MLKSQHQPTVPNQAQHRDKYLRITAVWNYYIVKNDN